MSNPLPHCSLSRLSRLSAWIFKMLVKSMGFPSSTSIVNKMHAVARSYDHILWKNDHRHWCLRWRLNVCGETELISDAIFSKQCQISVSCLKDAKLSAYRLTFHVSSVTFSFHFSAKKWLWLLTVYNSRIQSRGPEKNVTEDTRKVNLYGKSRSSRTTKPTIPFT